MRDHSSYDYAIVRVVPRVEREEFVNVGAIVSCPGLDFLQARIEVFNITNTPHFANPNSNVANVVYNPDGSILALNGFAAVTGTNSLGREYDERYIRIGVRLSF